MGTYVYIWIHVCMYGYIWGIYLVYIGLIWVFMGKYGYTWVYFGIYGCIYCIPEYRDFSTAEIGFWPNLVNLKGKMLQNMPK